MTKIIISWNTKKEGKVQVVEEVESLSNARELLQDAGFIFSTYLDLWKKTIVSKGNYIDVLANIEFTNPIKEIVDNLCQ